MAVKVVGFRTDRLNGTDLAILWPFDVEVDRSDGLRVKATVHVVDGQLVCRALNLSTEDGKIDRELLNGLRLATMLRQAALEVVWRVGIPTQEERSSANSRFDPRAVASDAKRNIARTALRGPRRLSDEFLGKVARTYREALRDRRNTADAVASLQQSELGLKGPAFEATARRWISAARKGGFLAQTTNGRKGELAPNVEDRREPNRRGGAARAKESK